MVLGKEEIPNRCAVIVRIVTVFRFVRATRVADDADDENDWFKVRKYSLEKGKNRQRDRILKEEKNGGRRNESKAFHCIENAIERLPKFFTRLFLFSFFFFLFEKLKKKSFLFYV